MRVRGGARRALALLVIWSSALGGSLVPLAAASTAGAAPAGAAAAGPQWAQAADRVPVVLVHGIRSPAETWGSPDGDGLLGRLVRLGYRPGRTLFWSEAGPWRDPVRAAHTELAPLLRRAAAAAGTQAVDVVAHSSGALLLQHLLRSEPPAPGAAGAGGPGPGALPRVRQVILVAPFSAGHDGAALAREAALRAALLDWHRQQGAGRNTGVPLPRGGLELLDAFDEAEFVTARAYHFYEPAYHRFVREGWFLRPPDDPQPSPDFWRWLEDRDPDLTAELLSQDPPVAGGPPEWGAGTDLTRAYYERAALDAARVVYHSLRPVGEVLWEEWQADIDDDFSDGWLAALARFLGRRLARLLAAYAPPWLEHGRDAALNALFSGSTGVSPLSAPVRRLQPLDDNLWLQAVRLPGGWGGRPQGPRVVAIGGRLTGPLAALLPDPADLGAGAALPWAGDVDDLAHTVGAWWGVDAGALPRHRAALDRVVEELGRWDRAPTVAVAGATPTRRVIHAATAEPSYLRPVAAGPGPGDRTARWSITLKPEAGFLGAWAVDPSTGRRVAGLVRSEAPGEPITLVAPAGALVGVRLLPPGQGDGPSPAAGSRVPVRVTVAPLTPDPAGVPPVGAGPVDGGAPAAGGPGQAGSDPGGPPAPPAPAPESLPAGPDPDPGPANGGGHLGGDYEGLPLIRVVLRSRLTTDKRERREHHGRWTWDFGDGHGFVDDDAGSVVSEVGHRFRRPGTYTVTARAESNQGRTIRTLTWQVDVPQGDEGVLHAFRAESIYEPQVALDLQGPVEWVAGRPAVFALEAAVQAPPHAEVVEVRHYPAERFAVLWERPGDGFVVRGAVWVKVRYTFPEGRRFTVQNIYTVERTVDVLALGSDGR